MPKTTLYLIRHGSTHMNHEDPKLDRVKGMRDVPLDERGLNVAEQAGKKLKDLGVTHVLASDLSRGRHTAEIIASHTGAKVAVTPRLRPWDVGMLSGKPYYSVSHLLKYYQQNPDERPPGGEKYRDFHDRFKAAVPELLDFAKGQPGKIAVVVHSRHLHALDSVMTGGDPQSVTKVSGSAVPGAIMSLDVEPD